MREPAFWWRRPGTAAALLSPFAAAYGVVAARRMAQSGERAPISVICVGNFTLGGSGKTPAAIAIARMLQEAGARPFCLSRGYGGKLAGPVQVDPQSHGAADVGDEALLLARVAPTIVSRDRVAGAKAAHGADATVIVMDDGLQNPSLVKDFTIVCIDARRGLGNARVFPAGPLRAPLVQQFSRADALLIVGEGAAAAEATTMAQARQRPVWHAKLEPDSAAVTALKSKKVLAFAGIGDPDKFFATVTACGIAIGGRQPFPDHHRYSAEECASLLMRAEHEGLELLTTEKDLARMSGDPQLSALATRAQVLPVTLQIKEEYELRQALLAKIGK
jgi:tetraacyldisaccharide 4'-kinase